MHLKRLTCQGFKSFADKVDFDFQPGVMGIVGPNGCGKSNVVDAIKWVLGDQSAKSLRGDQMQDVIFFGSGTRKSAGLAQVDLVFDNTDRTLGLEVDEVKVSRRLYRSGESEYLINNSTVRLKDIKELFMDTGIGVSAYSIIEQGKVAALIQANPAQRRAVFEEAAGISRYKARKVEAQRKLARVDQNLLRIGDTLEEVERNLRSVKLQAGKARNFQVYDQQLREKRATYALAEYHRLTQDIERLTGQVREAEDQASERRTAISTAETEESTLRGQLDRIDIERQQLQQQILSNTAEMTEKRARADQSQEQMETLTKVLAREQERLAGERQRAIRLQKDIAAAQSELDTMDERVRAAEAVQDRLGAEDGELGRQLAELETRQENEKAELFEHARRTSQLHNDIQSHEREQRQFEAEKQRLLARQEEIRNELAEHRQHQQELDQRAAELAELIQRQTTELEAKEQEAIRLHEDQAELNRQLAAAKEHRSGMNSRKHTLIDLDRQLEGVDAGIRELLHRKEQDPAGQAFSYVWGMVADLVAADVSNAVLIETALGEFDQYIVVENSRALLADSNTLADFPGRIQAICLDLLPPFEDGRDFTQQVGFVAYAMDLVRFPNHAERLVKHLLGRTIVVRTMEDALRMARENPPNYRYVTLSGQLLDPQGVCQLGPAGARAGLISRKSELREIDDQIAEVEERIGRMTGELERASAEAAALQQAQQSLRDARAEARAEVAKTEAARNNNTNAIERLERIGPELTSQIEAVEGQWSESQNRIAAARQAVGESEVQEQAVRVRIEQAKQAYDAAQQQRGELRERLTRARIEVAELGQQRRMLLDRVHSYKQARQASEDAVRAAATEVDRAEHNITSAERTILTAQSRLAELFHVKEQLDRDVLNRSRRREEITVQLEAISGQTKGVRAELDAVEERLSDHRLHLQEARIHTDDLVGRIREELEIELAEAYQSYEHQEQDWAAIETEIRELKDKIRRLGNVNLDAITELEQLEERYTFLSTQNEDLTKSKKSLEELIEQLNHECRERFSQTFDAVRGNFNEMFRKLFGGGKAELSFVQPPEGQELDVLEAGIEIFARPPGKELRTNSLLSGGEKTMTAIALLMAIFKTRPSPFTLMDEVDAALDEANNERFNRIILEFLDRTQFVVITHQKPTMSIADVLYGITMQEAGVSKRVSVKFDQQDGDGDAAVA